SECPTASPRHAALKSPRPSVEPTRRRNGRKQCPVVERSQEPGEHAESEIERPARRRSIGERAVCHCGKGGYRHTKVGRVAEKQAGNQDGRRRGTECCDRDSG